MGKDIYNKMPIELKILADVFQRELSMLIQNMSCVLVYINDILLITKMFYEKDLQVVEKVLKKIEGSRGAIEHRQILLRNIINGLPRLYNQP